MIPLKKFALALSVACMSTTAIAAKSTVTFDVLAVVPEANFNFRALGIPSNNTIELQYNTSKKKFEDKTIQMAFEGTATSNKLMASVLNDQLVADSGGDAIKTTVSVISDGNPAEIIDFVFIITISPKYLKNIFNKQLTQSLTKSNARF